MIGDVVPMQAVRTRLKIWRRINIAHSQRIEIRHDRARLGKREPAIELQPIGASGDAWVLLFHSKKQTSNAQRRTSNTEIQSLTSTLGVRRWAFGVLLHPLRHFDAEKIQSLLQNATSDIA